MENEIFGLSVGMSMSCGFCIMLILDHIFNQLKIRKANHKSHVKVETKLVLTKEESSHQMLQNDLFVVGEEECSR